MEELIKYFYNIEIDEYKEEKGTFMLRSLINVYVFKKIKSNKEEFERVIENCITNNVRFYKVLLNKEKSIFTKFNEEDYVLMEVQKVKEVVDLNLLNIHSINTPSVFLKDKWSQKVDFFIKQIYEFGTEKKELIKVANYYIGLAENAISVYNEAIREGNYRCAIQHKRMYYPNYAINYYDPTEMVIDCITRDYAEYYKTKLIKNSLIKEEILFFIEKNDFTLSEIKMFFARMLYPTYFFDYFEKEIINPKFNEEDLKKIVNKNQAYLNILMELEKIISKKYNLNKILWIKKELQN